MQAKLIKTNGEEKEISLDSHIMFSQIEELIGAECLDHVNISSTMTMWVDDNGYETKMVQHQNHFELQPVKALKPVNKKATKLYHSICLPGTTHEIVGDVVITTEDWGV